MCPVWCAQNIKQRDEFLYTYLITYLIISKWCCFRSNSTKQGRWSRHLLRAQYASTESIVLLLALLSSFDSINWLSRCVARDGVCRVLSFLFEMFLSIDSPLSFSFNKKHRADEEKNKMMRSLREILSTEIMKLPIYLKSKIVKRFQIPNNWRSCNDDTFLPLEQETVDDTMALNIETRQSCIISTWQAYPAYCISNDAPPRHASSDVEVRIFYHAKRGMMRWWEVAKKTSLHNTARTVNDIFSILDPAALAGLIWKLRHLHSHQCMSWKFQKRLK